MRSDYLEPLLVSLTDKIGWQSDYNDEEVKPTHNTVIRPIVENCLSTYVYGLKKEDELYKMNKEILINEKGKYKFDLSQECIIGHEKLWNAKDYKRGSIIVILENLDIDFQKIFKETYDPCLLSTPNTGNSLSATKKCREEAKNGKFACCFNGCNGIDWMTIYGIGKPFETLVQQAFNSCRQTDYYKKIFNI